MAPNLHSPSTPSGFLQNFAVKKRELDDLYSLLNQHAVHNTFTGHSLKMSASHLQNQ